MTAAAVKSPGLTGANAFCASISVVVPAGTADAARASVIAADAAEYAPPKADHADVLPRYDHASLNEVAIRSQTGCYEM